MNAKLETVNKTVNELNKEIQDVTQGFLTVVDSENLISILLNFNGSTVSYKITEFDLNIDPHFIKQKIIIALNKQLKGNNNESI